MIAIPSIMVLAFAAILTAISTAAMRKPWQRQLFLGIAAVEAMMAVGLIILVVIT